MGTLTQFLLVVGPGIYWRPSPEARSVLEAVRLQHAEDAKATYQIATILRQAQQVNQDKLPQLQPRQNLQNLQPDHPAFAGSKQPPIMNFHLPLGQQELCFTMARGGFKTRAASKTPCSHSGDRTCCSWWLRQSSSLKAETEATQNVHFAA